MTRQTLCAYALSEVLWRSAEFGGDATHEIEMASSAIIDPQTGEPVKEGRPRVLVPDFPEMPQPRHMSGVVIDPTTGEEVTDSEGRPRRPLISEVPERRLEIIPSRSEHQRNEERLEQLRRQGVL